MKPARWSTWSISSPTTTGASAFDKAGPSAIQLNTRLRSLASLAISPASRWMPTAATATAPPVARAAAASATGCCDTTATSAPAKPITTPTLSGLCKPWRSARRPAHSDSPIGATANKDKSTPTTHSG